MNSFFRDVGDAKIEDVCVVMGNKHGPLLHGLCPNLNLSHPDLEKVFSCELRDATTQSLKIAQFTRMMGFSAIRPYLPKMLKSEWKEAEDQLMALRVAARLYQPGNRDEIRRTKVTQTIDLSAIYKKGQMLWDSQPEDFSLYLRNSTKHQEEIEKTQKHAERFAQLGCESMAAEIMKSVAQFQGLFDDCHYGFRRLTMSGAALICAKMNGFKWISGLIVRNGDVYAPMIYPAHEMELPGAIKETINHLDHYPESGNNPIFDHYIIVVPHFHPEPKHMVLLGEKDGKCYFILVF